MGDIVPIDRSGMSVADYTKARAELRAIYGETSSQAGAHLDQALAELFVRSGWTQEQLAEVEGKKRVYVHYRLVFGRFLAFVTTVTNPDFAPIKAQLTERRFRDYWSRTKEVGGNERQRFIEVQRALANDLRLGRSHAKKQRVGAAIKTRFADNKWHGLDRISDHVRQVHEDVTPDDVFSVLDLIVQKGTYGLTGEKQKGAKGWRFKLVESGKFVPLNALMQELGPLLEGLEVEGRKNVVTASPGTVANLTWRIRQVLKRLTEGR